jgi:hypothetical protein
VRFVINIRKFHESDAFEFGMAIEKLKRHKSTGIVEIQT